MNKTVLKKISLITGLILLGINFIIYLINSINVIEALYNMIFETFAEFGELESFLTILGIFLLSFGLLLENNNMLNEKNNNKIIRKYKILRFLGCLPFIGILFFAIFSAIYGLTFLYSTSYGFDAFFGTLLLSSLFLWPLYIIGIFFIIISSLKIRKIKKFNN